ncbi:MAG: multifunctional CCA addition/repair protein [Pseudomonadota bacterium]
MNMTEGLEYYLVGGAVRDRLLGLPVKDRDWVVVGATPDDMLARGFKQVGADFPVFLHPHSGEEYALARVERKAGHGYKGFTVDFSDNVTLEEDLQRRDLTINAIAEDANGNLIDPYDGHIDLKNRVLRHVSDAFIEDPLRVLRVARFATRFVNQGFVIDTLTMRLMTDIVAAGELEHLTAERVWSEMQRALTHDTPSVFFRVLRACGALAVILPEVDALFGVPQPEKWHPEIDTGLHTLLVIDQAASMSDDTTIRFAGLMHDLGKALTPKDKLPSHPGHETAGARLVSKVCERLKVPNSYKRLAEHVAEFHTHCHRAFELRARTLLNALKAMGAFRDPVHLKRFVLACEADAKGRTGLEDRDYPQAQYFLDALDAALSVSNEEIAATGVTGKAFGEAVDRARLTAIKAVKREWEQRTEPR